ncbi:MAG: DegT/DnrJ/EryC1/StrS family aminotransferase [Actinobacteria bacterium]|nr:DegT/DnrJ/EryC1/StrS family aminotransferase [Actinomycetota bacterium]
MTTPFVPPARPTFPADDRAAIAKLVEESLAGGSLTLGPNTERLEETFAGRHQIAHAVAVSSGTAALEIAVRVLGDPDGSGRGLGGRTVIVPANTFFATAAAVIHAGGVPRFADIDPVTFALSPVTVEPLLDDTCAGVVIVHIGGFVSPDTAALADLCHSRGLWLLEDAAHAHGAAFAGRPAGSIGDAGAFSFYPTKVITSGEGGIITAAGETLRDEARIYRDQGKAGFLGGDHVRLGYAWRMSELHAAVGLVQMARLDEFIGVRRRMARLYDEALSALPGITPVLAPDGSEPNYYKYLAVLDEGIDRVALKNAMRVQHNVGMSGEVYASPLHRQPVFAAIPTGPLPVSEDLCARHVCLPIHNDMADSEAEQVIEGLRQVLNAMGG